MKRILITGKNSYVGISFKKWVSQWPDKYQVDEVETRDNIWKNSDFSKYDSIIHVAGIAHNSSDPKLKELYYEVNRDLTYEVALKAKEEGVEHFIFMSSMIVYGTKNEKITKDTKPTPDNFYGDSKLQAEQELNYLDDDNFKIAIIRPPMVYGIGSKGNYPKLAKLARFTPVFPDYDNKRSMIHIDNLCEFFRLIIEYKDHGTFHPQNEEYIKTSDMVKIIAEVNCKRMWTPRLFNRVIKLIANVGIVNKVFGNLYYEQSLSYYNRENYQIRKFKNSIKLTEE